MTEEFITGDRIYKYAINNSKAKQMYSFPKSSRFISELPSSKMTRNHAIYDIPGTFSLRKAAIGYGKKYSIESLNFNNDQLRIQTVPYYDTEDCRLSTEPDAPKYSFGLGRSYFGKVVIGKLVSDPIQESPGPAVYNTRTKIGQWAPCYTLRPKVKGGGLIQINNYPGPGTYKSVDINKEGLYPSSRNKNTERASWSKSKFNRFRIIDKMQCPGPGRYDINGLLNGSGKIFNSKFHSGTAKSMGHKFRGVFDVSHIDPTPGPGSYTAFSEFGFYKTTYGDFNSSGKDKRKKKLVSWDKNSKYPDRSKVSTRASNKTSIISKNKNF